MVSLELVKIILVWTSLLINYNQLLKNVTDPLK